MLVRTIMTENPFTVYTDTPLSDAQALMRREKVHRLPVLNHSKELAGIISEKDLLYASPSPASTLNVYEMSNLLAKVKVGDIMTKKPVTVAPDDLVEDAARLMSDHNIGGLPVMEGKKLVGIITESDVFRLFIDLFGTREKGLRITIRIPEGQGELGHLGADIAQAGGNIISIGTWPGHDKSNAVCILKVADIARDQALKALERHIIEVIDVRSV